ncbi:DUF2264 domain-containing protein [Kitasatospora sp. RG8]|uniref:DUF2264 domain-containing protein n=1 Tax=Kitasatospora sp. RG8 TaxID=2820815 RepID=UPI001AE03AFA|nr:DUF2264 domain-containing protein [Kitasatospora sp. RG8]MBP0455199.1 DUF2264 domain-containing protein [Kitasatospora sp. RG8]
MQLPPEDRRTSPYTGWTRAHWEAVADALLAAVRPYAGPGQALINLPGPRPGVSGRRADGLEGYARTFLLAALRVAGARGADPGGLLERYAEGLDTGTRRPTAERDLADGDDRSWGVIADRTQPMVEAASIATALRLTRPWLWDRLDPSVRERAGGWLAEALHRAPVDNNWWLFPLTVGGFLAEAGIETEAADAAVDRGLDRIEQWYAGDGWYTDGRPRAFDHYNGWALHLYPVLHAHLAGDHDLTARYGARLAAHLDGYTRLFGADGAPVHQGRSLTYRFAAAAPLWAGALTGHTPLLPGATRRLASGALRHFVDRGAVGPDGLLSLGWYGAYPPLVQEYSGPASPYWASKGFLGLLLPADHPVWTDTELPGPAETADAVVPLPGPGWLVQSTAADGLVRLHNHGSDDQPPDGVLPDQPLYARFAHSTATGPVTGTADNHFALLAAGRASERGPITPLGVGAGWAASEHRPRIDGRELPGVTVTSLTLAHGAEEVRAHLVTGAAPGTEVRQSGWAVAGEQVAGSTEGPLAGARADGGPGRPGALAAELRAVHGYHRVGVDEAPDGTAFGPRAAVPFATGTTGDGPALFVCASRLAADRTAGADGAEARPGAGGTALGSLAVRAEAVDGGHRITVRWPDGAAHEARLGTRSAAVRPV